MFTDGRLPRVFYRREASSSLGFTFTTNLDAAAAAADTVIPDEAPFSSFDIVFAVVIFFPPLRDPMSLGRVQYTANATAQVRIIQSTTS